MHVLNPFAQKLHSGRLPLISAVKCELFTCSVCIDRQGEHSRQRSQIHTLTLYGSDECSGPLFQSLTHSLHMQFAGRTQQPTPSDPYGLMGLLGVIRMQDPDLTTLALGTDLTGLGLHLNSPENVYSTFASPWAEQPLKPEPEFLVRLLSCL